jgi:hypothetical protein
LSDLRRNLRDKDSSDRDSKQRQWQMHKPVREVYMANSSGRQKRSEQRVYKDVDLTNSCSSQNWNKLLEKFS